MNEGGVQAREKLAKAQARSCAPVSESVQVSHDGFGNSDSSRASLENVRCIKVLETYDQA